MPSQNEQRKKCQQQRGRHVRGWQGERERRSGNSFNLQGEGEGVLPVFPYQSHSSESLTCSSYSHHNNLQRVQCVCVCVCVCVWVHVRSPTVNSNKQQGRIKYVCQVKNIIDFPSRPHVTTAWIMTCNNLHSTPSSTLVRGRSLSVRNNWKVLQSI